MIDRLSYWTGDICDALVYSVIYFKVRSDLYSFKDHLGKRLPCLVQEGTPMGPVEFLKVRCSSCAFC